MLEKHEILEEIFANEELRNYFGITEDSDTMEELESLIPFDFLSQAEFIKFFLSIKPSPVLEKKIVPVESTPKTYSNEYPVVVLNSKQLNYLETVFKDTDVHGDMAVQKFEYLQSLRTDDDVIKILSVNAIEIAPNNFITLEEVLDRIQESGDLYEYITYSQFLSYIHEMFPKKNWVSNEVENPKISLDPLYIQILQDVFDSIPRKAQGQVSTNELIDNLKEDPQVSEFLKVNLRENLTVEDILNIVDRESAKTIT